MLVLTATSPDFSVRNRVKFVERAFSFSMEALAHVCRQLCASSALHRRSSASIVSTLAHIYNFKVLEGIEVIQHPSGYKDGDRICSAYHCIVRNDSGFNLEVTNTCRALSVMAGLDVDDFRRKNKGTRGYLPRDLLRLHLHTASFQHETRSMNLCCFHCDFNPLTIDVQGLLQLIGVPACPILADRSPRMCGDTKAVTAGVYNMLRSGTHVMLCAQDCLPRPALEAAAPVLTIPESESEESMEAFLREIIQATPPAAADPFDTETHDITIMHDPNVRIWHGRLEMNALMRSSVHMLMSRVHVDNVYSISSFERDVIVNCLLLAMEVLDQE